MKSSELSDAEMIAVVSKFPAEMPTLLQNMAMCDWFIKEKCYPGATGMLHTVIAGWNAERDASYSYILCRACRMLVELLFVMEPQGNAADIQQYVFSKVTPHEWLGSQGIASTILKRRASRVGDLVLVKGIPTLVHNDGWCTVCNQPGCHLVCGNCKESFYCGPEHHKSDFPRHKTVCFKQNEQK